MATRIHLFPFRTQKLSSSTAKVLDHPRSGRIASCRISIKIPYFLAFFAIKMGNFLFCYQFTLSSFFSPCRNLRQGVFYFLAVALFHPEITAVLLILGQNLGQKINTKSSPLPQLKIRPIGPYRYFLKPPKSAPQILSSPLPQRRIPGSACKTWYVNHTICG